MNFIIYKPLKLLLGDSVSISPSPDCLVTSDIGEIILWELYSVGLARPPCRGARARCLTELLNIQISQYSRTHART